MIKPYAPEILNDIDGYIYFIQMDRIGPIKIGYTTNVGNRLINLQVSSPYPLKLLCIFPANKNMERELHSCYQDLRMDGEWFLPHPKLFEQIEERKYFNKINGFETPNPELDFRTAEEFFQNPEKYRSPGSLEPVYE